MIKLYIPVLNILLLLLIIFYIITRIQLIIRRKNIPIFQCFLDLPVRQLDLYVPVKKIISESVIKLYHFVKYLSKLKVPVSDADGSIHHSCTSIVKL